jgi:uncharacterized protein
MIRSTLVALAVVAAAACTKGSHASDDGDATKARATDDMEPSPTDPPASDKRARIRIDGTGGEVIVSAEVVASPRTIERGLMYRTRLPPEEGMLFLMGEERDHVFWMHNTLIALDMIFIGSDMKVAGVVASAQPRTDTRRSVGRTSVYVLEVNGGWAAAHGVAAGAAVRFEGVEQAAH